MNSVTEAQAQAKWCPHIRHTLPLDESGGTTNCGQADDRPNLHGHPHYRCNCVGSQCMAWRWSDPSGPQCNDLGQPIEADPDPIARRGHCGLAGQP